MHPMDSTNTTQRIYIAIALTALSHKPPAISLSSYLIDLNSQFPAEEVRYSQRLGEDDAWRRRALALEEENEALKLRTQEQELEVLALKATSTPVDESNMERESSQAPKKKRKKVAQESSRANPEILDLKALIKDLHSGPRLPLLKDSLDVLTSFKTIQTSDMTSVEAFPDHEALLTANAKRSLAALGQLLSAALAQDTSVVAASSRVDIVGCLCSLLLGLLNTMIPLAPRHQLLPHILGDLTTCIIRPIIRSFQTLSMHTITSAVLGKSRNMTDSDFRPELLSILRRLIDRLRSLKERTRDLREFIIFETAKEIEALWRAGPTQSEQSRERRIEKLARKDSLWYQCSVLHAALDHYPPSRADRISLLSGEAVRVLVNLVQHLGGDQVGEGMVLGVVEKAWLSGLYKPVVELEDLE